ncbi:uncharacterized protein [Excalfactoria chinensis]|uniref:uncharacterized protein isoform X4 n=1 Tax=Excalfactoria chinensis TaxID=46218 RepID=UPI003B3A12F5
MGSQWALNGPSSRPAWKCLISRSRSSEPQPSRDAAIRVDATRGPIATRLSPAMLGRVQWEAALLFPFRSKPINSELRGSGRDSAEPKAKPKAARDGGSVAAGGTSARHDTVPRQNPPRPHTGDPPRGTAWVSAVPWRRYAAELCSSCPTVVPSPLPVPPKSNGRCSCPVCSARWWDHHPAVLCCSCFPYQWGSCSASTDTYSQALSFRGSAGFSGTAQEAAAENGPEGRGVGEEVSCAAVNSSKTMEAPVPPMAAPLCLVHNEDCKLSLNPAALAVLRGVTQPVVVVAIVGPLDSGKSFLVKRLAQKCTGSPLGNAVQTQTKGIWMWCLPHPCKPGVTLVLLDTEGLGKDNKGDSRNDAWIYTLALLLSSTLVFNSKETSSHLMLEKLRLMMDLTHHVRVHVRVQADKAEPDDEFARIFPGIVWVMRDYTQQEGERPIEFMTQMYKLQRRLRSFFPHQELFMLERPAADRDLARLEVLREDQLRPRFRQQEEAFYQHIWKEAPVKVLLNRSQVTGKVLACLVETYLTAITTGSVLCMESALTVVAEAENSTAVEEAMAEYQRGMEQGLMLPVTSHDALMAMHQDWKQRASTFFLSHAFANTGQCYQALLMDKLEAAKEEFCRRNEAASERRCRAVLQELWGDGELHMQRGHYTVPGGMQLFQEELKRVVEEFKQMPDKGVKAEAVLEEFLREKRLEMTEMWLDRADQQCKEVLDGATATARVLEERLEERLEEHRQQQRAELLKLREVKEVVELRICNLEKQQEVMLAEVAVVKMGVEKQLEEQQQAALDMVTAAQEAAGAQLKEQRQQQQVMLAEVAAVKEALEKQLEEQRQQQQVMLAEVTATKKAVEKQLEQQQQQVALAEVTTTQYVAEVQLEERWQQWAQQLREEQSLVLSQRLEELEAQLQEGRGGEAAALQQVEPMQEEEQAVLSWRSTLLKFLEKVVMPILIILVKRMVNNAT